ncbi:MAG TPA: hypothetical protein VGR20_23145 [Acidimicrobiia bacterium]|nr:hypothetical protein [Acidimicrobiia bacterium]
MARPQQPELARSAKTDIDPNHVETGLQGQPTPATGGETGPIPPDNQPGHHPAIEQDKPDLDAFAVRLGTDPKAPSATKARKPPRPKTTAPKTPAEPPAATSAQSNSTTRPANTPTPPAAAPAWPESAPAADDLGPLRDAVAISAPQPEPNPEREPLMVALALLPLRETVKRLERLEETLTERLTTRTRARAGRGPRGR